MSARQHKNNRLPSEEGGGMFSTVIRQVLAVIICAAVILGMRGSQNLRLRGYAEALGRALRYDSRWQESAREAMGFIKNILPSDSQSESPRDDVNSSGVPPLPDASENGGVSFQ